ncbi:MAG: UDP-N-acetylglucosamine pyrophosphorylase [Kiritimatiellia bacterium]|nr:UDP-N-acetylglucosamine pyrophosphorylase [Kiritimatiellia bacterium]
MSSKKSASSPIELRRALMARGIRLRCPETIDIGPEVDPERIASDVVIHPGCRLRGRNLVLGPGCVLGEEAPLTVDDCQCGRSVRLQGGFCSGATFLDGASMGSAAHVRPGTLLEEGANGAHAVGFKQTILMPFVTTGSLINFCDCLMAGGTSREDHSEVGSSYVHFNYTPHRDKATASLMGDVPRGVMLDQPPIFLGGQGGLAGPVWVGFGAVIPAGVILRRDIPDGRVVYIPDPPPLASSREFIPGRIHRADRRIRANLRYLGNLAALREWYREARSLSQAREVWGRALCEAGLRQVEQGIRERIRRLDELVAKLAPAADRMEDELRRLLTAWPVLRDAVASGHPDPAVEARRDAFLSVWEKAVQSSSDHLGAVRALPPEAKRMGTVWLQTVVDTIATAV